jgi:hypothetical protein
MTISELMQKLKTLDPETKIVIRGYEDGYNDILTVRTVKIKPIVDAYWYLGEYEDSKDTDAISAAELYGENKNSRDDL